LDGTVTARAETAKASAVRVLHVDDDAVFLRTVKAVLEIQGAFQVDTAASVEEAVEKMKEEEYDVVVCARDKEDDRSLRLANRGKG
jgi:CheY-like chemotaxis protein